MCCFLELKSFDIAFSCTKLHKMHKKTVLKTNAIYVVVVVWICSFELSGECSTTDLTGEQEVFC